MQRLEHGRLHALPRKGAGARQRCRAGAHAGNGLPCECEPVLQSLIFRLMRQHGGHGLVGMILRPIRHEALQVADAHRVATATAHAVAFALRFLRAHAPADGWKRIRAFHQRICLREQPFGHKRYEFAHRHAHRAAGRTRLLRAAQAAARLVHGHLGRVSQGHLVEVAYAQQGRLRRHGRLLLLQVPLGLRGGKSGLCSRTPLRRALRVCRLPRDALRCSLRGLLLRPLVLVTLLRHATSSLRSRPHAPQLSSRTGRTACRAETPRRSPPDGRRNPDRPRTRACTRRPLSRGSIRTCRCRQS